MVAKVEDVKNWLRPLNPTEAHSCLGLIGYHHRFVEGFSSISVPLTKFTHKSFKFQWSDVCKNSFKELKDMLTSTSILALPEGKKIYFVYFEALRIGLGCILM